MSNLPAEPQPYRFSVDQFNGLAETGVIPMDTSVELIDGVIFETQPLGPQHCSISQQIGDQLIKSAGESLLVRIEKPIILNDFSEPVPDLAVVRKRQEDPFFSKSHPDASEVNLLIEVSDSSYLKDRNVKLASCARASIPEVWIVNVASKEIQWFAAPDSTGEQYSKEGLFDRNSLIERSDFRIDFSSVIF